MARKRIISDYVISPHFGFIKRSKKDIEWEERILLSEEERQKLALEREKERLNKIRSSPKGYYNSIPYDKFSENTLEDIIQKWEEYRILLKDFLAAKQIAEDYNRPLLESIAKEETNLLNTKISRLKNQLHDEIKSDEEVIRLMELKLHDLQEKYKEARSHFLSSLWETEDAKKLGIEIAELKLAIEPYKLRINNIKRQFNQKFNEDPPRSAQRQYLRPTPSFNYETKIKLECERMPCDIDISASAFKVTDVRQALTRKRNEAFARAYTGKTRSDAAKVKKEIKHQCKILEGCPYCGLFMNEATAHADHIYPVAKGGQSTQKNMVYICVECNRKKKAMTLRQFIDKYELNSELISRKLVKLKKDF